MAWYDPTSWSGDTWKRIGIGAATGGLSEVGKAGYDYFYGDPAKNVQAAYDQAMGQSEQRAGNIRDFLMGQQQKALGYYQKPQAMFDRAYGQGLQPQQLPGKR